MTEKDIRSIFQEEIIMYHKNKDEEEKVEEEKVEEEKKNAHLKIKQEKSLYLTYYILNFTPWLLFSIIVLFNYPIMKQLICLHSLLFFISFLFYGVGYIVNKRVLYSHLTLDSKSKMMMIPAVFYVFSIFILLLVCSGFFS